MYLGYLIQLAKSWYYPVIFFLEKLEQTEYFFVKINT